MRVNTIVEQRRTCGREPRRGRQQARWQSCPRLEGASACHACTLGLGRTRGSRFKGNRRRLWPSSSTLPPNSRSPMPLPRRLLCVDESGLLRLYRSLPSLPSIIGCHLRAGHQQQPMHVMSRGSRICDRTKMGGVGQFSPCQRDCVAWSVVLCCSSESSASLAFSVGHVFGQMLDVIHCSSSGRSFELVPVPDTACGDTTRSPRLTTRPAVCNPDDVLCDTVEAGAGPASKPNQPQSVH